MRINNRHLRNINIRNMIGTLYAELYLTNKGNLLYYMLFMIRRLIFSVTAIYSSNYSSI
jgi:hypothetical protein